MACGRFQQLLIQKNQARSAKNLAQCRRALREHVKTCKVCMKKLQKISGRA